jgi:mono/diheme cytochrome c family protein
MLLGWPACAPDGDAGLPADYRRGAVPEALSSPESRQRGRAAFVEYCVVCHGERGDGQGPRREGLTPRPRDLTSPVWRGSATPRRVFYVIREGLAPSAMPSWKALSVDQTWDLTAYVLSLGGEGHEGGAAHRD